MKPGVIEQTIDTLAWLGLDYDEGPYYQTQRFDRYKEVINDLLARGKAYRCYCSRERLDELRRRTKPIIAANGAHLDDGRKGGE